MIAAQCSPDSSGYKEFPESTWAPMISSIAWYGPASQSTWRADAHGFYSFTMLGPEPSILLPNVTEVEGLSGSGAATGGDDALRAVTRERLLWFVPNFVFQAVCVLFFVEIMRVGIHKVKSAFHRHSPSKEKEQIDGYYPLADDSSPTRHVTSDMVDRVGLYMQIAFALSFCVGIFVWHQLRSVGVLGLIAATYVRSNAKGLAESHKSWFRLYYIFLHYWTYVICDISLLNGFVNDKSGVDWEVWVFFLQSILLVHFVSAMITALLVERRRETAWMSASMTLLPVVGTEVHLFKDKAAIAVFFQLSRSCEGPLAFVAYSITAGALFWYYAHLIWLFDDHHVEESLRASHWPYVEALPVEEHFGKQAHITLRGIHQFLGMLISSTTVDKQRKTALAEMPMALLTFLFAYMVIGSNYVIFALCLSLAKYFAIPLVRTRVIPRLIMLYGCSETTLTQYAHNSVGAKFRFRNDASLLHVAASKNYTVCIQYLVNEGANVNARDSRGKTPLHQAVQDNSPDAAWKLISLGADVRIIDKAGKTALDYVSKQSEAAFAAMCSASKRSDDGSTLLHIICGEKSDSDLIAEVPDECIGNFAKEVKHVLELRGNVSARLANGRTPLHLAASIDVDAVQAMLGAGADPKAEDAKGATPLHCAVEGGRIGPITVLDQVTKGFDTAKDKDGNTPRDYIYKPSKRPREDMYLYAFVIDSIKKFHELVSGGVLKKGTAFTVMETAWEDMLRDCHQRFFTWIEAEEEQPQHQAMNIGAALMQGARKAKSMVGAAISCMRDPLERVLGIWKLDGFLPLADRLFETVAFDDSSFITAQKLETFFKVVLPWSKINASFVQAGCDRDRLDYLIRFIGQNNHGKISNAEANKFLDEAIDEVDVLKTMLFRSLQQISSAAEFKTFLDKLLDAAFGETFNGSDAITREVVANDRGKPEPYAAGVLLDTFGPVKNLVSSFDAALEGVESSFFANVKAKASEYLRDGIDKQLFCSQVVPMLRQEMEKISEDFLKQLIHDYFRRERYAKLIEYYLGSCLADVRNMMIETLPELLAGALFQLLDLDNNDKLSSRELTLGKDAIDAIAKVLEEGEKSLYTRELGLNVFDILDRDGDGRLSTSEFAAIAQKLICFAVEILGDLATVLLNCLKIAQRLPYADLIAALSGGRRILLMNS
eukprot:TRINITY_DN1157_c0_g1_i6.p1 TRINITY_DN1157_c0_g1~~TRINITY_DN1157_c0_g1_i6.p1  ORF type:complete len:1168 (-),score=191.44 TRINITY_DN1157_c0_g1_i6:1899-5402(-)